MVKNSSEIPSLLTLFKKDSSGEYIRNSILYYDILRFFQDQPADKESKRNLKSREVAYWLLKNNREFIDRYQSETFEKRKRESHMVVDILDRIKDKLETFVKMGILESRKTSAQFGEAITLEYEITDFGKLIFLLMDLERHVDKSVPYKKIYEFLIKILEKEKSSKDIFALNFFKNCDKDGIFKEYIDRIIKIMKGETTNKDTFFDYLTFLSFESDDFNKKLWKIWKKTIVSLPVDKKELFMNYLKIQLERLIDPKINGYNTFEIMRFSNTDYVDEIVVEYQCNHCSIFYPGLRNIISYIDQLIEQVNPHPSISCEICKSGKLQLCTILGDRVEIEDKQNIEIDKKEEKRY